jgi:Spy/CpxP family protein refolding chaperone
MRVLMALALMASPLLAQQPPQQDRGTDFMVQRLKDRLKLSDDQAAKVKEILAKESEDRTKMDDARTEKINALLDADQKKLYEELRTNQRGFRGGGPGGPGGNQFQFGGAGGRAMGTVQLDDAKKELGLTDEQVEKIKPLYDEFNANIQKRAEELRDKGLQGLNFADEMTKYQENLKGLAEKVKVHLTDEQKTKLDGLMERATGWMRMIPNLTARLGGGGAAPRPSVEDRVRSVIGALKIEKDDERSAIADLVAKVVKAQYELEDFTKSSREKLSEAAKNRELSDAAVEDRIKEAQEDRRSREKMIVGYQKQLAEVVTNRQELELMSQGILK